MNLDRRVGVVLATVVAVLLLAGFVGTCRGPQPRTLPPPSSTSSTQPDVTTTDPDYSLIALEAVPGETTTTTPMAEGSATLRGAVVGPDGPVPNAIVRADRLVGDAVQRNEVRTGEDGTYTMSDIPGGRFRVRAFLPPTFAMDSAEVFFLEDGADRELRLVVQAHTGLTVRSDTAPGAPVVGNPVNLAVRVAQRTVDDDGVAREVPQAGVTVRVNVTGWTRAGGAPPTTDAGSDPGSGPDGSGSSADDVGRTDAEGVAVFSYRCDRVTNVTATAVVGDEEETFPLDPPPCRPVPTTTTTTTTTAPDDDEDGDDEDDEDDDDGTTSTSTSTTEG